MSKPWAYCYIGLPWRSKAYGPDAYDCWGLVSHCLRAHYGLDMPLHEAVPTGDVLRFSHAVRDHIKTGLWQQQDEPAEGSVVLMARGRIYQHIGLYTGGRVLHSHEKTGVCLESLTHLRRGGLAHFQYWIHDRIAAHPQVSAR